MVFLPILLERIFFFTYYYQYATIRAKLEKLWCPSKRLLSSSKITAIYKHYYSLHLLAPVPDVWSYTSNATNL